MKPSRINNFVFLQSTLNTLSQPDFEIHSSQIVLKQLGDDFNFWLLFWLGMLVKTKVTKITWVNVRQSLQLYCKWSEIKVEYKDIKVFQTKLDVFQKVHSVLFAIKKQPCLTHPFCFCTSPFLDNSIYMCHHSYCTFCLSQISNWYSWNILWL